MTVARDVLIENEFEMTLLPGFDPSPADYLSNMERGAEISDCGRYRTRLWRRWDSRKGRVLVIMLNPSTADASQDDPTIRRCIRFAIRWECGCLEVRNLFALRATDQRELLAVADPVGPNNLCLVRSDDHFEKVVAAWGSHGGLLGRSTAIRGELSRRGIRAFHLGLTKSGEPRHPLYVPYQTPLQVL